MSNVDIITDFTLFCHTLMPFFWWYLLEFVSGLILFFFVLWQRVYISLFRVRHQTYYFVTKAGQFGLFIQSFMGFLLMVDAIESSASLLPPKIVLIIFAVGCILQKSAHMLTAMKMLYSRLVTHQPLKSVDLEFLH